MRDYQLSAEGLCSASRPNSNPEVEWLMSEQIDKHRIRVRCTTKGYHVCNEEYTCRYTSKPLLLIPCRIYQQTRDWNVLLNIFTLTGRRWREQWFFLFRRVSLGMTQHTYQSQIRCDNVFTNEKWKVYLLNRQTLQCWQPSPLDWCCYRYPDQCWQPDSCLVTLADLQQCQTVFLC